MNRGFFFHIRKSYGSSNDQNEEISSLWQVPAQHNAYGSEVCSMLHHLWFSPAKEMQVHPQEIWSWHQAEWCSWHTRGKGWLPEGPRQAWEIGPCQRHELQQDHVQGRTPGSGQSQAQIQVGWRMAWEQPSGEGFGGVSWWKTQHEPTMCTCNPEGQLYPSREVWPAGRGSSTLLSWDSTWSTASSSRSPNTRRTCSCLSGSREGPWIWSEG